MAQPIVRKKILLIEDEEATYTALIPLFKDGGFEVLHAADGAKGLATASQEKPDVILLDIIIPGLSGLDVLVRLKQDAATKNIPVLILSQLSDQDSISRGISLGARGYLVKSEYQLEDILKKVRDILK